MLTRFFLLNLLLILAGCSRQAPDLPPFDDSGIHAVVTQSGGTALAGDMLPLPGNWAEVTGTQPAVAVMILENARPAGEMRTVWPVAVAFFQEKDTTRSVVLAIPAAEAERLNGLNHYMQLKVEYDWYRRLLENWFLHRRGEGAVHWLGWKEEQHAFTLIREATISR